ncbi:MAG: cell division protein Fic [marine bacterium B5-7]|nr:MAG: cell division protein Fic [marine bacterium B5-7]
MFVPQFNISNKMTNALTAIERARGFLEAATLSSVWIEKMQEKALVLEAHHTTHIEGTTLTLEQSEKLLAGQKLTVVNSDDAQEVLNYRKAFDLVSRYVVDGKPITESLIREVHRQLVLNVRGNAAAPGEYRKLQNYVVNAGTKEVIYTPPPAYEVPMMMQSLVDWIRDSDVDVEKHPVLVAGIAQFQLVHIHPFLDGNGRTARLLSTLCLYRSGYDFKKLFTISQYYDQNRSDYYKAIQSVRENNMDMSAWLEYFVTGLATQLTDIKQVGKKIIQHDVLLNKHVLSDRQQLAITHILEHRHLGIQEFEDLCPGLSRRTLQRELKVLLDANIIEGEGSTSDKRYILKVDVRD